MTSINNNNNSNNNKVKFNQHPIVSILLWALGGDSQNDVDKTKDVNSNSNNNILQWKDVDGGNIHEYMSQVQISAPITKQTNFDSDTFTQLQPESAKYNNENLYNNSNNNNNQSLLENSIESPQWGFYVSITPPQQETFSTKNNMKVQHNVK